MAESDEDADNGALATVTRAAGSGRSRPVSVPARMRAVWPPGLSWTQSVGAGSLLIGRIASEECSNPLVHETVSRKHLSVRWDSRRGQHVAEDLGSHNGSRIAGADVGGRQTALADGEILQLGDVLVVYERGLGLSEDTVQAGANVSEDGVPGQSPSVLVLRSGLGKAATDPSPVLLLGETGTGKEWIAREVHRLSGRGGPLVAINCSALSPQIIDSQLFGHVKGAFTGATADQPGVFRAADGGTLFLDEIGDLPLELQPKLLRALEEREVQPVGSTKTVKIDVRVVAATNQNLAERVESGAFRRDLYARLALWELAVPPLRERRGDLLAWVDRLYTSWQAKRPQLAHTPLELSPEAAEAVLLYDWPNNLREIDRLVHELGATELSGPVSLEQLPAWMMAAQPSGAAPTPVPTPTRPPSDGGAAPSKPPVPSREEFVAVFEQLDGNVRGMAKHFGRDRRQIYRWIEAHGLSDKRPKSKD